MWTREGAVTFPPGASTGLPPSVAYGSAWRPTNLPGVWPSGRHPRELLALGIREYREVFFEPYRIICRVMGDGAYVLVIADGRRDMRALLQRRLLRV